MYGYGLKEGATTANNINILFQTICRVSVEGVAQSIHAFSKERHFKKEEVLKRCEAGE
jgi:hypothetical protein